MPSIDEVFDSLGQAKYISRLDLAKGFYQVPLSEASKHLSAFVVASGHYEFNYMPFGMCNAPKTCARLMDTVLQGCKAFANVYVDDIVIFSNDFEDHINHLDIVFKRIGSAGLTIKPSKCVIGEEEITLLGHIIGKGMLKPVQDKLVTISNFPILTRKKDIRSFLGLINYYGKFCARLAEKCAPFTDLLQGSQNDKIVWTDQLQKAFDDIKTALNMPIILHIPQKDVPFIVYTDASDIGMGAALVQLKNATEVPIRLINKKFNHCEKRYATIEKECYAIVWSIMKLQDYLLGSKFTVRCDHAPLQWLMQNKETKGRRLRWALSLQPYKFNIEFVRGVENNLADSLSRVV